MVGSRVAQSLWSPDRRLSSAQADVRLASEYRALFPSFSDLRRLLSRKLLSPRESSARLEVARHALQGHRIGLCSGLRLLQLGAGFGFLSLFGKQMRPSDQEFRIVPETVSVLRKSGFRCRKALLAHVNVG